MRDRCANKRDECACARARGGIDALAHDAASRARPRAGCIRDALSRDGRRDARCAEVRRGLLVTAQWGFFFLFFWSEGRVGVFWRLRDFVFFAGIGVRDVFGLQREGGGYAIIATR